MAVTIKSFFVHAPAPFSRPLHLGWSRKEMFCREVNVSFTRILQKCLLVLGWNGAAPLTHAAYADATNGRQVLEAAETAKYIAYYLFARLKWLLSHVEDV